MSLFVELVTAAVLRLGLDTEARDMLGTDTDRAAIAQLHASFAFAAIVATVQNSLLALWLYLPVRCQPQKLVTHWSVAQDFFHRQGAARDALSQVLRQYGF